MLKKSSVFLLFGCNSTLAKAFVLESHEEAFFVLIDKDQNCADEIKSCLHEDRFEYFCAEGGGQIIFEIVEKVFLIYDPDYIVSFVGHNEELLNDYSIKHYEQFKSLVEINFLYPLQFLFALKFYKKSAKRVLVTFIQSQMQFLFLANRYGYGLSKFNMSVALELENSEKLFLKQFVSGPFKSPMNKHMQIPLQRSAKVVAKELFNFVTSRKKTKISNKLAFVATQFLKTSLYLKRLFLV